MFDTATLVTYVVACVAIIIAPGPGPAQALVLARSIGDGRRAGMMTAIGLNVGTIVHAIAAALGLSAVLATSAVAFAVVKFLGAAYLVYLGLKALTIKQHETSAIDPGRASPGQAFAKAVVTGILNPKVALFFLAFLPQFINPQRGSVFLQFLILGLILAALASIAGSLSKWFTHSPRFGVWRQRITGAVLVGLGIRLALVQRE